MKTCLANSCKQDLDEEPTFVLDEGRTDLRQLHRLAALFPPQNSVVSLAFERILERIQTLISHPY